MDKANNKKLIVAIVVIVVILGLLFLALSLFTTNKIPMLQNGINGKKEESETTTETTTTVERSKDAEHKTFDKIPDTFPDVIPRYEGATFIEAIQTIIPGEFDGTQVRWSSEDSFGEVFDFYLAKFESDGWDIQNESKGEKSGVIFASKDGMLAILSVSALEKGSDLTILAAQK